MVSSLQVFRPKFCIYIYVYTLNITCPAYPIFLDLIIIIYFVQDTSYGVSHYVVFYSILTIPLSLFHIIFSAASSQLSSMYVLPLV